MGVTFVIGNAELDYDVETGYIGATVGRIELDQGYLIIPGDDSPVAAKKNSISFSYAGWREYLDIFSMPIIKEWYSHNHSGITILTKTMQNEIKQAIVTRKSQLPAGFTPGFVPSHEILSNGQVRIFTDKEFVQMVADTKRDGYWAHLEILDFWMSYALAHCELPAIYNF